MTILDLVRIAALGTLAASGAARAEAPAAPTATLSVTFAGVEAKEGQLLVALYDESGWTAGKPVRVAAVDAAAAKPEAVIAGLPAGRYGVKAFHDMNGNGRMDTNPFGMPTEPFAFSNDARGRMGPAAWSDAAFAVPATGAAQTITIR